MKKLPRTYFIMPNGIKIDTRCDFGFLYTVNQIRTEFAKAFQVPKDFLFPDEKLVDVTVKEPRADLALTDELRSKGSFTVTFNFVDVKDV
jgi:hypothetical protein